jgi:predicted phage tail protein
MTALVLGSKGGGSSTPTQADDTLSSTAYAQILDLISEGPIYGFVDPASAMRSAYFDNTVIQNQDGSNNFNVKQFDYRLGTIDQAYISGFESSASEVSVGVELKASSPWTHTVTNLELNAIRITLSVNALSNTDPSSGNIAGYRVAYQVQLSIDGGSFSTVLDTAFDGKCSSVYERSHRIELSGASSQYTVRVVRTTADTTSAYIQDTTNVVSYTELIDAKLRYPMSAVVGVQLDASQFSSVPTRSYDVKGLLIKYPSNYNPTTREYAGVWNGTFVTGWTDNPAWVFYDLVLNTRYGAGEWVDATMIDRYALYQIAQYCDVMVSDGAGGLEPRFTCNCYITSRADAFKVLQDLASVFRGMAYWSAGNVTAAADMPSDPVYVYTAANVIGGAFKYVGSSLKTRYTVALVTWNDPENAYQQAVEYVEDEDGVARYGLNKAEITAFACTSRGQAQRVGHWTLLTSRYETNSVTFSVGLDGTLAQPGQVIAIADASRAGKRMGGRIRQVSGTNTVTLDKPVDGTAQGDTLTVVMPNGVAQASTVTNVSGPIVTVNPPFSTVPATGAVWMLESATLKSQLFRVSSVTEADGITFNVVATQHEPGKFAAIDNGAAIDVRPVTGISLNVQMPPTNVRLSQYVVTDQGIAKTNMVIAWDAAQNATAYTVDWRKDNGEWVTAGRTGGLSIDVSNIYTGAYTARVRAINAFDITSPYAFSSETVLQGKTGAPPTVSSLTASQDQVFAIRLAWSFPPNAADTAYTEVYYSSTNSFADAVQLGRYSYPTNATSLLGLAAGAGMFFWARLVDTSGNIGPWYPSDSEAGVYGVASSDATQILSYLTGQITATQLAQSLLAPIESIPDLQQQVTDTEAAITSEQQARIDGDSALSQRVDRISAQVLIPEMAGDNGEYAGDTTVYAGVWSESSARAEADLALAQKVDTTTAQITSTATTLISAVQTETQARIDADSAQAQQITTVQSQTAQNTAAVQTVAQSYADLNGRVSASYQIKTQITANGRTYIAGIGIGVDNTSGTVESQVLVAASRFSVIDPNGAAVSSPFVVQGGQVFMNQAFIGTGWITNAMIGGVIQSTAIGANGLPRWILDKNGVLTLNGANGGSGYMTINDSQLLVFDNNGTLRVRLGIW